MSKEELLKYLIAEIDLIMHDKDYRFENQDGTWYSRESCRDLTNEEMFEELKGELRQLADLEAKLAESEEELLQKEKKIEDLMLCEFVSTALDFNKLSADNCRLREQLAEKDEEINVYKKYIKVEDQDKISFAVEQLEKVKELILKKCFDTSGKGVVIRYYDVYHIFDNQIKQLKEITNGYKQDD